MKLSPYLILVAFLAVTEPVYAIIPVIDSTALVQLMQQLRFWQAQIASETGGRGMERLASQGLASRNFLPVSATELDGLLKGNASASAGLGARVRAGLQEVTVLQADRLAQLSPAERQRILDSRQAVAVQSALMQSVVETTSQRFSTLQSLVDAIPTASDPKAIADLAARIGAEQVLLANDQAKQLALQSWGASQNVAAADRLRETAVLLHGRFASRFQPVIR